jgi:hypothetical protein
MHATMQGICQAAAAIDLIVDYQTKEAQVKDVAAKNIFRREFFAGGLVTND